MREMRVISPIRLPQGLLIRKEGHPLESISPWKTTMFLSTMVRTLYSMSDICHGDLIHDILSLLA